MKHLYFFEFEDLIWTPDFFRNMITQITQFNLDFFKIYDPIIPKIDELLKKTGTSRIIDLCSGSSGPWPKLINQLKSPVKVILTDKYPNIKRWEEVSLSSGGRIGYFETPLDALEIPGDLKGLRTIFTGFHHFQPEYAKKFLERTVSQGEPIAIFEFTDGSLSSMLRGLLLFLFLPFVQTPFIKPRTLTRFFWTYIVPVVPVLHWWDGLVSNLRTYRIDELQKIVNSIDSKGYQWKLGVETLNTYGMKAEITFLIGYNPQHLKSY